MANMIELDVNQPRCPPSSSLAPRTNSRWLQNNGHKKPSSMSTLALSLSLCWLAVLLQPAAGAFEGVFCRLVLESSHLSLTQERNSPPNKGQFAREPTRTAFFSNLDCK